MATRCRICGRSAEHDHPLVTELDPLHFDRYEDFETAQAQQVVQIGGKVVRKDWAKRNERPADVHLPPHLLEYWTPGGKWQVYREVDDE